MLTSLIVAAGALVVSTVALSFADAGRRRQGAAGNFDGERFNIDDLSAPIGSGPDRDHPVMNP